MKYSKLYFPLELFACYKSFAAQNCEFERFGGFCIDSYYMLWEGVKSGKTIFNSSSAKQIRVA